MPAIGKDKTGGSPAGAIFRALLKAIQGILGFAVLIICFSAIGRLRDKHPPQAVPFRLVFATVVSGISTIVCPVYCIRQVASYQLFGLDWVVFLGWLSTTGLLGRLLSMLAADITWGGMPRDMIAKLFWLALSNMVLWFATAVMSTNVFLARHGWRNGEDDGDAGDGGVWELPPYEPVPPRLYRYRYRRRCR